MVVDHRAWPHHNVRTARDSMAHEVNLVKAHRPRTWRSRHASRVRISDTAVVITAVVIADSIRFRDVGLFTHISDTRMPYIVIPVLVVLLWKAALRITQADDLRVIGAGSSEYNAVLVASLALVGLLAFAVMTSNFLVARGYWAIVFSAGTVGLLLSRAIWRRLSLAQHLAGRGMTSVLVIGDTASAANFTQWVEANPGMGYRVRGVCPTDGVAVWRDYDGTASVHDDINSGLDSLAGHGDHAVALTAIDSLKMSSLRELVWKLDEQHVELMVVPGTLSTAGPRLSHRWDTGMQLMHIERPRYVRATKLLKRAFDVTVAALLALISSPVLLGTAILVKCGDRGPILYRATRVGLSGETFNMWKFRTMVVDADQMLTHLNSQNEGNEVMFKIRDDPRVTRIGRFLRRYSIDELPQLFNVIGGTMSLVGPRPPLASEVATYDKMTTKRMLVRPGMTGLWQVSGRSNLTWEQSVNLDLSYVENWSLASDVMILWRTFRAVIKHDGAY